MANVTWELNGLTLGADADRVIVGDRKFSLEELDDLLEQIDWAKEYVEAYLEDLRWAKDDAADAAQEGGE